MLLGSFKSAYALASLGRGAAAVCTGLGWGGMVWPLPTATEPSLIAKNRARPVACKSADRDVAQDLY